MQVGASCVYGVAQIYRSSSPKKTMHGAKSVKATLRDSSPCFVVRPPNLRGPMTRLKVC